MKLTAIIIFFCLLSHSFAGTKVENNGKTLTHTDMNLSKAVEIDELIEQHLLQEKYMNWVEVLSSHKDKIFFLRKAAKTDNLFAQEMLAYVLWNGQLSVTKNYKESIYWYKKAARNGSTNSKYLLGLIYLHGKEVKQDFKTAKEWLMQATENGNVESLYLLGLMTYGGYGSNQSTKLAYFWFNLASILGNKDAETLKEQLKNKLSVHELKEVVQLSDLWLKDKKIKRDRWNRKLSQIINT